MRLFLETCMGKKLVIKIASKPFFKWFSFVHFTCDWPTRPYLFFVKSEYKVSKAENCFHQINLHRISLPHLLRRVKCKTCSVFLLSFCQRESGENQKFTNLHFVCFVRKLMGKFDMGNFNV